MGAVLQQTDAETQWIHAIRAGDVAPFRQLYAKYARMLFCLCLSFTRDEAEAEEQLQEIFMRILDRIDSYRGDSAFSTWAYQLAKRHLLNHQRGRAREPLGGSRASESAMGERAAPRVDPELKRALEEALGELPEEQRMTVLLHDHHGFGHEEIAGVMNCSAGTSRSRLARARAALREKLSPIRIRGKGASHA